MMHKGTGLSFAMRLAPALLAFAAPLALQAQEGTPAVALTSAQSALVAKAAKLGATDIKTLPAPGGGFVIGGAPSGAG